MPGPEQLIRAAVALPVTVARRALGIAAGLLPGFGSDDEPPSSGQRSTGNEQRATPADLAVAIAADDALTREREPVEEQAAPAPPVPSAEEEHVDAEVELVAESADVDATEPPGPEFHVDEPWEGYRRMKVADITARLDGQPPEVLAAVEMYEATHRKRRGVLGAVRGAARA